MEAGKYSQLQEEMKAVIRKLYQNQQEETYPWIGAHIQEIKDSLLEQITYYTESNTGTGSYHIGASDSCISESSDHGIGRLPEL